MASYDINWEIASFVWSLSLITYVFYQDISSIHQLHCLQSSDWTDHQQVAVHISTGHNPKSFVSGRGAI